MGNTSPADLARELLRHALESSRPSGSGLLEELLEWAAHPDPARALEGSRALFSGLVEPLADRFEPALCLVYAELFARAIPDFRAGELVRRYQRVRRPEPWRGCDPARVFVLSRVTLGADVAVTSVLLDALKRRFPRAAIVFAGPRKAWELFEDDPRLSWLKVDYGRGASLAERLSVWPALRLELSQPDALVVDPDSRLTQLGLLPVCEEASYRFFESRSYGGDGDQPLPELARRWAREIFGVEEARAYISPRPGPAGPPITVSLGVGGNPAKRVADPFEEGLLGGLAGLGPLLVDRGAGGEERERVNLAIARSGARVETWDGAFAPFAARIAGSRLYVGYDSAGQHVAAACGVPLVSVFSGFVSERMFARWRPAGPGPIEVQRVEHRRPGAVLESALSAAKRVWSGA